MLVSDTARDGFILSEIFQQANPVSTSACYFSARQCALSVRNGVP